MRKMKRALMDAAIAGQEYERGNSTFGMDTIDEIAQRCGDLEFTREEVRGMLVECLAQGKRLHPNTVMGKRDNDFIIDGILSRHTEGDKERSLNREEVHTGRGFDCESGPADLNFHNELIELTKRVAAIEKRVLADGHSENCRMMDPRCSPPECTCGHDHIQKPDPGSRV